MGVSMLTNAGMCLAANTRRSTDDQAMKLSVYVLSSLSPACVFTAFFERNIVSSRVYEMPTYNWGQRYSVKTSPPRGKCTVLKCTGTEVCNWEHSHGYLWLFHIRNLK